VAPEVPDCTGPLPSTLRRHLAQDVEANPFPVRSDCDETDRERHRIRGVERLRIKPPAVRQLDTQVAGVEDRIDARVNVRA